MMGTVVIVGTLFLATMFSDHINANMTYCAALTSDTVKARKTEG
jgi:hypothetical protein